MQDALLRANQLCRELNDSPKLFRGVWRLWRFRLVRGEVRGSLKLAEECMEIAKQMGDASLVMEAQEAVGCTLYHAGNMKQAQEHLAAGRQLYDAERHRSHAHLYGQDPDVSLLTNEAQVLWYLGFAEQACAMMEEALARADRHGHTASIAYALIFAAGLYQRAGDAETTLKFAVRTIEYSRVHSFAQWVVVGTLYRGWAKFSLGDIQEGLADVREGFQGTLQTEIIQLRFATLLAEVTGLAGQVSEGLKSVSELLESSHRLGELEWAVEMYRVEGELLALQGSDRAAASFQQAIALARRQGAKSLELRAAISLARLWQQAGKIDKARLQLSQVLSWFTEGFDMPDLVEAQKLLRELAT